MKNVIKKIMVLLVIFFSQIVHCKTYIQQQKVLVYHNKSPYFPHVKNAFDAIGVEYETIESIDPESENTHIIFDAMSISKDEMPKHYIIYQSYDLDNTRLAYQMKQLMHDYTEKLHNAIAIWDYSWKNIDTYRHHHPHFYYLPNNYEYADPVVLPCLLPSEALKTYRELLAYSNQVDTEISSLIPMLFFHSYEKRPQLIVESGVCFGYSTQAFIKTAELCGTELVGLDFSKGAIPSYDCVQNGTMLCMDDLAFGSYYSTSKYKNQKIDVLFIDTSHEYQHTLDELRVFLPLLASDGVIMFHDANVTPLRIDGRQAWWRINNTTQLMGPLSPPNPRGVAPAIRTYFAIPFDETKYINTEFTFDDAQWQMIHYPFCNGLTVLKRLG